MTKPPRILPTLLLGGAALAGLGVEAARSASIFTLDWGSAPADTRFYTTFGAGGDLPAGTAATNSNETGNNPGPGFTYVPTGVAWLPNTTYTVDLQVYDRGSFPEDNTARFEFGLWAGLPSDDAGSGNYAGLIGPGETLGTSAEAMNLPALGVLGQANMTDAQVPNGNPYDANPELAVMASQLLGATTATFTTGPDVSGLGEMVVFMRNADQGANNTAATNPQAISGRSHWNFLTVTVVPEPSSGLLLLSALGLGLTRRRRK